MSNIRTFRETSPKIATSAWVDESAVVIGDVNLGDDASVWPLVVIRGDIHQIRIGHRTNIQDGSVLHVTHPSHFYPKGFPLTIGSDVTIGHQVILHGCDIQDTCLVGMGSKVLDGAVIESHVMVGAGSLVPGGKVLESGYLWLGSPVKKIRPLTDDEVAFLHYSAKNYSQLAKEYKGMSVSL